MSLWSTFARAGARASGSRQPPSFLRQFSYSFIGLATWLPILIYVNDHVADITRIVGPSMYPLFNKEYNETLRRDLCLSIKWDPQRNLERGMIVMFWSPNNPESQVVKRVVGLEGDIIRTRQNMFVRVPQGHIWVEGDAGEGHSIDSNNYGAISRCLVTGRLTHILYPFHRAGRIRWWEHPVRPGVQRAFE